LALGDSGQEASQGGAEIASGHIAAGEVIGDILAGGLASKGLRFLACVERAEVRMARPAGSAALASIGKGESTQRGTVLGAIGHGSLQKERLDLGFLADSRRGEAHD
jgi:hypothetical protein